MVNPPSPPAPSRRVPQRQDRLRWGLTGLAAVFLLVMVTAAGLRQAPGAEQSRADKPGTGESLAVLGVAPGPATRPAEP